jgi:hypothetical protein
VYTHFACSRRCETILIWSAPNRYAIHTSVAEIARICGPTFATPFAHGLLANANRQTDIAIARQLLDQPAPELTTDLTAAPAGTYCVQPTFVCRLCDAPMLVIATFARAQHIRAPPPTA